MSPYQLLFGKECHLPIELDNREYWVIKRLNLSMFDAGKKQIARITWVKKIKNTAYKNFKIYKTKIKAFHDKQLRWREFKENQREWFYNSRFKLFLGKLKSRLDGPFIIIKVSECGAILIEDPKIG